MLRPLIVVIVIAIAACGSPSAPPAAPAESPAPAPAAREPAPLAVTDLDPRIGDAMGGTEVTIRGRAFQLEPRAAKVYFGTKPAAIMQLTDDTLLVVAPGGTPDQVVDVRVLFEPGGELTLPAAFTYAKP